MKKLILNICAVMMSVLSFGETTQTTLDSKLYFKNKEYTQQYSSAAKGLGATSCAETISVIGTLREGAECPMQELESLGIQVFGQYYGLVAMKVSIDKLEALGHVKAFTIINEDGKPEAKCDKSHQMTHVADVQDLTNLPDGLRQIYTGKDVLVGVIDYGFDFQHKNFKDADGKSRIRRVWLAQDDLSLTEYSQQEQIDTLTTDFKAGSHGSHTTGIAAGSYNGEYTCSDGTKISGMRGAAYEANLLLSTYRAHSTMFDAISRMWAYARSQKKPLVVSMSLGENDVWMDGSSDFTTFLKNITKGGTQDSLLVCLASSNEGWQKQFFYKKLDSGQKVATGLVYSSVNPWNMWIASDDATQFNVTIKGYNADGTVAHTYQLKTTEGLSETIYSNLKYYSANALDHDNRFYYNLTSDAAVKKEDADYVLEISADKPCGIRFAWMTGGMGTNKLNGVVRDDLYVPDGSNSLSTYVQHKYAFAVGACTSRVRQTLYNGNNYGTETNIFGGDACLIGDIAPFTSWVSVPYNNKVDSIGVDFLAPGNVVLSSVNHYDVNVGAELVAKADDNNYLGAMYGTSMATPNAAGIMALWLQACPSLSVAKVREIIKKTADNDDYTRANPRRAGLGKINCLAGLQEILKEYPAAISQVNEITGSRVNVDKYIENGRIVIKKDGKRYNTVGQEI